MPPPSIHYVRLTPRRNRCGLKRRRRPGRPRALWAHRRASSPRRSLDRRSKPVESRYGRLERHPRHQTVVTGDCCDDVQPALLAIELSAGSRRDRRRRRFRPSTARASAWHHRRQRAGVGPSRSFPAVVMPGQPIATIGICRLRGEGRAQECRHESDVSRSDCRTARPCAGGRNAHGTLKTRPEPGECERYCPRIGR